MRYKTCVTVAQDTPKRLASTLRRALAGSELAELRLDFLKPADIPDALHLTRKSLPRTVCTLRPPSQGGRFSGTERERASILRLISEYGPHLLDVELQTALRDRSLMRYISKSGTNTLVSWHDFKGTPRYDTLLRRLESIRGISKHAKIVTTAKKPSDAARILSLYARSRGVNLVSFAMGDEGRMSRILCLYLGSPFTYVSLGRPVAPGQFGLSQMRRILGSGSV